MFTKNFSVAKIFLALFIYRSVEAAHYYPKPGSKHYVYEYIPDEEETSTKDVAFEDSSEYPEKSTISEEIFDDVTEMVQENSVEVFETVEPNPNEVVEKENTNNTSTYMEEPSEEDSSTEKAVFFPADDPEFTTEDCFIGPVVLNENTCTCIGFYPIYYYSFLTRGCTKGVFGGCRATRNHFPTLANCLRTTKPVCDLVHVRKIVYH